MTTSIEDSQRYKLKRKSLAKAEENISTSTPLLRNEGQRTYAKVQSNFHCRPQRCCISSRAAVLILIWNLILVAGFESLLDPNFFRVLFENDDDSFGISLSITMYSAVAFLFLFYPLAGCLNLQLKYRPTEIIGRL